MNRVVSGDGVTGDGGYGDVTGDKIFTGDLTGEDFVTGDVNITAITGDTVTVAISA